MDIEIYRKELEQVTTQFNDYIEHTNQDSEFDNFLELGNNNLTEGEKNNEMYQL